MAVNMEIIHTLEALIQGKTVDLRQGGEFSNASVPAIFKITGEYVSLSGQIADTAAETIWDGAQYGPIATFKWGWIRIDGGDPADTTNEAHIQLIDVNATGTHYVCPLFTGIPYAFPGRLLGVANETKITNASTTLRNVDQIVIGNDFAVSINYVGGVFL